MKELYFTKPYRRSLKTLRLEFGEINNKFLLKSIEGEINGKGTSEFSPREEVFENDQVMLKEVWELRKRLSEDRWTLETKEESPNKQQTSFITLKTIDGDSSMVYDK
jgi:hypothetical protein